MLGLVAQSCLTLCNPMDCSPPGSSVHGILQARYWSGLPCPPPWDLPNPGIELVPPALQADSLPLSHQGSPVLHIPRVFSFLAKQPQLLLHFLLLFISYLTVLNYPRLTIAQFLYPSISLGSNSMCYNANRSGLGHGDPIPQLCRYTCGKH